MVRLPHPRIIFITGTGTGVGKTLLMGLLLHHLRQSGCRALAIKPFCSGGTADIEILHALQDSELTREEISPFYFREPIAPLVAARLQRRKIPFDTVLDHIRSVAVRLAPNFNVQRSTFKVQSSRRPSQLQSLHHSTTPFLLIEGSGGLLVPLGEGYTVLDLILKLDCEVIVVSRNRLGTINHTLLTVQALQNARIQNKPQPTDKQQLRVVMMNDFSPRYSTPGTRSNPEILAELMAPIPLHLIPFLGRKGSRPEAIRKAAKKMKKSLAQILR